jgi:hypothetical protein
MNPPSEPARVLILRFWRETRQFEGAPAVWRGMVEDAISGERVYVKEIEEILTLIVHTLKAMEVNL